MSGREFGAGRPAKSPTIDGARSLSRADVENVSQGKNPAVRRLRDSHHMVARLCAMGLRSGDIAKRTGYSLVRISTLRGDPSFEELVSNYRDNVNEEWKESVDEYFETVNANRTIAARLLNDKLTAAEPDDIDFRTLVSIHADAADRTGYPKRSVAVNVNVDFAAQLDRAISRSAQAKAREPLTIEGTVGAAVPQSTELIRRRA